MESGCHVMLLRVNGEYLASSPFGQLFSDLFDEFPFLGIELLFWKITCLGDDEANIALQFRIKLRSVQGPQAIRMIWIEQMGIQHRAQHGPVASVLFQSFANRIF